MWKWGNISPYIRRPLVIYDFATAPFLNFLIYGEVLIFFFINESLKISNRNISASRRLIKAYRQIPAGSISLDRTFKAFFDVLSCIMALGLQSGQSSVIFMSPAICPVPRSINYKQRIISNYRLCTNIYIHRDNIYCTLYS